MLQTTASLNLAMYLLLKKEQSSLEDVDSGLIQSHPIMARMQKWNSMLQKLEEQVEDRADGLETQLNNLVKAAALMSEGLSDEENAEIEEEEDEDHAEDREGNDESLRIDIPSLDSTDEDSVDTEEGRRHALNEARFGLRTSEIKSGASSSPQRKAVESDLGDEFENDVNNAASRALASTLNSIEQRSLSRKRKAAPNVEALDEPQQDNSEIRQALEMMETELGKDPETEYESNDDDANDPEVDEDDGEDELYKEVKRKSKSKKELKKSLYAVAPKYPRLEKEIEGERAVSRTILKNRGLVAHKNKLNRNPRVKKREQYRKRLIQRKGTVREVRTDEGHKYSGEATGIKSGLTRSRKLAR